MKLFSFIQFPNAKALKLKVKSRRIFKISLLCNTVKFDRASADFCRDIVYSSPFKLHDRFCETSFQTLIEGNLGNVSAGVLIVAY